MIKKIIILSILILSLFVFQNIVTASCTYTGKSDVTIDLDACLKESSLVKSWNLNIETWVLKWKIIYWVKKIAWFLGLVAVWALVYAGFMMAISGWEEEKVKKAKDIVKWTILWFLWIVVASSLIAVVVNFMYSFWK